MTAFTLWLAGVVGPKAVKPFLAGLAVLALAATFLIGDHNGATRIKNRFAAERATANAKALETDAPAKEQASIERATDTANITAMQKEQIDAIHGDTDAELRRNAACARLRASRGDQAARTAGC